LGAGLDWKTSLQERSAELEMGAPEYKVSTSGPDHDKHFKAWVLIGDETFAPGEGSSKKAAEQIAAANAYRKLREEHPDSPIPPAAS
jgi:ribonuclease-3